MGKGTQCVHSGLIPDHISRGMNSPIFTSSTIGYLDVDENVYPLYFNKPNQKAVNEKHCALEKTKN